MGPLTDTHCHLNLNTFQDDLDAVIWRAEERGVVRILVPGIDLMTSRRAIQIAESHPCVYAAVGVHPSDANSWRPDTLASLRELASHPKVVAIGEIGLDYYRDRAPRTLQTKIFRQQLELAGEVKKPVSVHSRASGNDVWTQLIAWRAELLRSASPIANRPGVLHSYDGSFADAAGLIDGAFFLGVSGPVTFKNASDRHLTVSQLPLSVLLVETDAPYLTPHPFRGQRNEPAFTQFIVEKIAELHQVEYDNTARQTCSNAARLFAWGAEN